ncbi:MAG TPA: EAL domain-containing protein [Xanthobacteraceae bacterium]|nr:EAL domain-containing protein [Xanthobacteraceae bacterium]
MRVSAVFIGFCMFVIAGALGATAYLILAFSATEALAAAIATFSALAVCNALVGRGREGAETSRQIAELSRGTTHLALQVGELGRRVVAVETAVARTGAAARAATEPLSAEIEVLGTLVNQLADSVATHEAVLLGPVAPWRADAEPPAPSTRDDVPAAAADAGAQVSEPPPSSKNPPGLIDDRAREAEIRAAVEENRVDLYLQPIVALPQRKVRHYEAVARVRTGGGTLLSRSDLRAFERSGFMPRLDNLMLLRSVQVARRLSARSRDVALFQAVSGATLADAEFFAQMLDFLAANRALAPCLILQIAQSTFRRAGAAEQGAMAQITSLGFRFALDRADDLQIEPRQLAAQGFRYVKVPAALLLNRAASEKADIHAWDFANLLARYGVDLIVDEIDTEGTVVDLLDHDVRFGQGSLFAAPRPVRPETMQAALEPLDLATAPEQSSQAPVPTQSLEPARPTRRREPDPATQLRSAIEKNAPGLARLARNVIRRA